jgi:hypothetical protein
LNRSLMVVVRDKTSEEAWSGWRSVVNHIRILKCIVFSHILDQKRKTLDDKREKWISLHISDYSKAYKLYNPNTPRNFLLVEMLFLMRLNNME